MYDHLTDITDPVLESFIIRGLYGYKNINLSFEKNVKIVAAENGAGKTTILRILYALLSGQFIKLFRVNFDSVELKFRGNETILIKKADLFQNGIDKIEKMRDLSLTLRRHLTEGEIQELFYLYVVGEEEGLLRSLPFRKLKDIDRFENVSELRDFIEFEFSEIVLKKHNAERVQQKINQMLSNLTVLYLPTYRRIETSLPFKLERDSIFFPRSLKKLKFDLESDSLINFGLQDVEKLLVSLMNTIKKETLDAFSEVSTKTLDRFLESNVEIQKLSPEDVEKLSVVMTRLGLTQSKTANKINAIIESGEINNKKHEYLLSFLIQLIRSYEKTRILENSIEAYARVINSYWEISGAEKEFVFDKYGVSAKVFNRYAKKELSLDSLSSGEKQIMSIFSKLYLTKDAKYLVLIDEPELSLSLAWQRKFLVDILNAPSCKQLLAITHSPFVFDNGLEPYVGTFGVTKQGE